MADCSDWRVAEDCLAPGLGCAALDGRRSQAMLMQPGENLPQRRRELPDVRYVRDVMRRGVTTCAPDTPLTAVAALMARDRAGAVAVVNSDGELIGIISRTDLVQAYLKPFESLRAEDVMTTQVATIIPDIPVQAAVQIMLDRGVHQLIILHARPAPQRPVGILTMDDIVKDMANLPDSEKGE